MSSVLDTPVTTPDFAAIKNASRHLASGDYAWSERHCRSSANRSPKRSTYALGKALLDVRPQR